MTQSGCAGYTLIEELHFGNVEVGGETIGYTLYEVDARSESQRFENAATNTLDGNLNVYIPGHGQRATGARNLLTAIAVCSLSKVVWSIDVDPPRGGDPARAEALVKIVRGKAASKDLRAEDGEPGESPFPGVTVFGWSHGGAEALRAGRKDTYLVRQVVGLCPAGLTERPSSELAWSFILECLRIAWRGSLALDGTLRKALAVGCDMLAGVIRDLIRSRSVRRVLADICWAAKKVVGAEYTYDGTVVLLFGNRDSVIRWRDVFPACQDPPAIGQVLEEYRRCNFPNARALEIKVLDGDHLAPEAKAALYVGEALGLLAQGE